MERWNGWLDKLRWLNDVKIAIKYLTVLLLVIFVAVWTMNSVSLGRLKSESLDKGELMAQQSAQQYADRNKKLITDMTTTLGIYRDEAMAMLRGKKPDRELFFSAMGNSIEEKKGGGLLSFFTAWEPNGFDGLDGKYASDPAYAVTNGRFALTAAYNGSNVVRSQMAPGFEKEEYYVKVQQTKKITATKPYSTGDDNNKSLVSTLSIPIVNDFGKFLGVIGATLSLSDLQTSAAAEHPLGGYVSLLSDEGIYIANGGDEKLLAQSFASDESGKEVWDKVKQGEWLQRGTDGQGMQVLRSFVPIDISEEEKWFVQTVIPVANVMKSYDDGQRELTIFLFSTLAVVGVIVWLLTRYMITLRVSRILRGIRQLAQGDFTGKLRMSGKDEFGRMAEHLNETTLSLGSMMKATSDLAMNVGATSEELTSSAEQVSKSAETISQAIEEVASGMAEQSGQAETSSRHVQEVTLGARKIAQSASVVLGLANDVSARTEKGDQLIRQAVGQMDETSQSMTRSTQTMDKLREHSEEIGSIVEMIRRISSRTNILALNASIEASRAGEHGRGFAVVAAEIRKLAEQTGDSVRKVEEKIDSIRSETHRMTGVIASASSEVEKGSATVTESGRLFAEITSEMRLVRSQAEDVSSSVEQLSAGIEEVLRSVDNVKEIARMSTDNANHVAAASEEQLATMQEVSSSAGHLGAMVQELLDRLSKFKH
ncbi:methyl-accepting chemotaxis protein [Cohnella suwonensis]|uniref:Methyl-accepting chemotaxis protein n=1 Tax=Cohnella suwonensis TaxID=696072 RepID=A0ABW0LQY8_9BACL